MTAAIRVVAEWTYARCLTLFPRRFRDQHGRAMARAFQDRLRGVDGGTIAVAAASSRELIDLVWSAALERWSGDGAALLDRVPHVHSRAAGDSFARELRMASRRLLREPGFTAIVVLTLTLGIVATTTIFSVVEGVLLRPLPYRDADRLLTVWQWSKSKGIEEAPSPANFLDWREAAERIDLAAAEPYGMTLAGSGDTADLETWRVSERYFEIVGVAPLLGRGFHPNEHVTGRHHVVVLSHGLWQTRFGSDPRIVGRVITLDNDPYEVVGVAPPHIDYPARKAIWVPKIFGAAERRARLQTFYSVAGRLKPGVSVDQARDELSAIADRLALALPRTNKDVGVLAVPLFDRITGSARPILFLLLGAVGCVLIVSCANAANLLLARAGVRQTEMAVRAALGAARRDLLRLTLAESVVLSAAAAILGLVVSRWAIAAIVALAPADVPRVDEVSLNGTVMACAIVVAAATALACGLAPAAHFWTRSIESALRLGGRSSAGSGTRFRSILVAAQTALAVVLLAGSGLLVRSFGALLRVDLGYAVDHRAALTTHVWDLYRQPEQRAQFFAEVEQRIAREPGIAAVGLASALPLSHEGSEMDPPFVVFGRPQPAPGDEPTALVTFVTPAYFRVIGMRLVQGRLFTDEDATTTTPVIVVNETMARRVWPGQNPVGQRITSSLSFSGSATREVIGVVGDVRQAGLADRLQPAYYVPHRQVPFGSMTIIARTTGDAAVAAPLVQRAVWSVNPRVTFAGVETLEGLLRETLAPRRFTLTLLSGFSIGALVLASIGLYGLTSFAVGLRTSEIGIRMALGADVRSVLGLLMRQGLKVAWSGLAVGFVVSLVAGRYLTSMLFGVTATDPLTFAGLGLVMLAASAAACYVPARRAARVDPLRAIRTE